MVVTNKEVVIDNRLCLEVVEESKIKVLDLMGFNIVEVKTIIEVGVYEFIRLGVAMVQVIYSLLNFCFIILVLKK